MTVTDFAQMRFAYSPFTELIDSLNMLHSGQVHPLYRGWAEATGERVRRLDGELLRAVVPARGLVPSFPHGDSRATIEQQLQLVADLPPGMLRAELESVWRDCALPPAARRLIADGSGGPRRVADALWAYWDAAVGPWWGQLQAVLDADVAYRARRLASGGIADLMADLHPQLRLRDQVIRINKAHRGEHDLTGAGLLLIPCVFAWPDIKFDPGMLGPPSLVYGPRGIGTLWATSEARVPDDNALGTLLGRSRGAILRSVELPKSTTELARELGLSAPTVSIHLSTLQRCGMVASWRSGRRVLYQRTPLATSVVSAASAGEARPDDYRAAGRRR